MSHSKEELYENGIIQVIRNAPYVTIGNDIILNKNIDFYTLGVYARLKHILETNQDMDKLASLGKLEYIQKALNKLEQEGIIEQEERAN
jgi:hypothetical protein